jgi:type IV secretory pathway VirB2 component (pilin)
MMQTHFKCKLISIIKYGILLVTSGMSGSVLASSHGSSMPWDGPLQTIQQALSGTTAHMAILISIILSGIGLALGEHGSLMRKGMSVVIGGSIALGATSLYSTLNMGGALV